MLNKLLKLGGIFSKDEPKTSTELVDLGKAFESLRNSKDDNLRNLAVALSRTQGFAIKTHHYFKDKMGE